MGENGQRLIVVPAVPMDTAKEKYSNIEVKDLPSKKPYLRYVDCPGKSVPAYLDWLLASSIEKMNQPDALDASAYIVDVPVAHVAQACGSSLRIPADGSRRNEEAVTISIYVLERVDGRLSRAKTWHCAPLASVCTPCQCARIELAQVGPAFGQSPNLHDSMGVNQGVAPFAFSWYLNSS